MRRPYSTRGCSPGVDPQPFSRAIDAMPPQVRDFFEKIWPAVVDVSHPDVATPPRALAAALN